MGNLTERQLIKSIRKQSLQTTEDLVRGIGDDCSVFGKLKETAWLISTDMLVDTIHFDRAWHDPKRLGRKCIAVNLSDIAAMGGVPRFLLISISVPDGFSFKWLDEWFEGVREILAEYDCLLIGGDTVTGKELNISITVLGNQSCDRILYRNGAKKGDIVYVSGELGSSAAGLWLFQNNKRLHLDICEDEYTEMCSAHLNPVPQVELGKLLCRSGCVSAMQDISDGLATDLSHICQESEVRALIHENKLPCLPELEILCKNQNIKRNDLILKGGEDYQLVFTVYEDRCKELEDLIEQHLDISITAIGKISEGRGVLLETIESEKVDITFQGYEHGL